MNQQADKDFWPQYIDLVGKYDDQTIYYFKSNEMRRIVKVWFKPTFKMQFKMIAKTTIFTHVKWLKIEDYFYWASSTDIMNLIVELEKRTGMLKKFLENEAALLSTMIQFPESKFVPAAAALIYKTIEKRLEKEVKK